MKAPEGVSTGTTAALLASAVWAAGACGVPAAGEPGERISSASALRLPSAAAQATLSRAAYPEGHPFPRPPPGRQMREDHP